MLSTTWDNLIGATVAGRYRLRALNSEDRDQAEFLADPATPETPGEAVTIALVEPFASDAAAVLAEMKAASRLQHPNILRILHTGEWVFDGRPLLYLATEIADETLAEAAKRTPSTETARALTADVLAGLAFLHGQGLAYGSLAPETTVRVGSHWKLADLGRLRPIGTSAAERTEDIRALGAMLNTVLSGTSGKRLPAPFDAIVRSCLEAVPDRRPSLNRILSMLEPPREVRPAPVAGPPEVRPVPMATPQKAPAEPEPTREEPDDTEEEPRRWPRWAPVAILVAICLTVSALFLRRGTSIEPAPPPAVSKAPARRTPAKAELPSQKPSPTGRPVERVPAAKPAPVANSAKGQEGRAELASSEMDGRFTASGERFDSGALTAAHGSYPLGTRLKVTNVRSGRSVTVRVNDRGRFRRGVVIRLTRHAARELGIGSGGSKVRLDVVE